MSSRGKASRSWLECARCWDEIRTPDGCRNPGRSASSLGRRRRAFVRLRVLCASVFPVFEEANCERMRLPGGARMETQRHRGHSRHKVRPGHG